MLTTTALLTWTFAIVGMLLCVHDGYRMVQQTG